MRRITVALFLWAAVWTVCGQQLPKREFRGAWLHTVYQDGYARRSTAQNKAWLRGQLDSLRTAGVNAVVFQVRPQADAFYDSRYEPWSCYLTRDGKAPNPYWDPLEFMVGECHARGMELHAWLNPYRVTAGARQLPPAGHVYHKHPERFLRYDGKIYFDPALSANRRHIEKVVADIVERYDVDGIHFDDYFYPYPVKGKEFPDGESFRRYGRGMKRDDWRRANVDSLIAAMNRPILGGVQHQGLKIMTGSMPTCFCGRARDGWTILCLSFIGSSNIRRLPIVCFWTGGPTMPADAICT